MAETSEQKLYFNTIGDLKRAVAALPQELDSKRFWYIEISAWDTGIHVGSPGDVTDPHGIALTGE